MECPSLVKLLNYVQLPVYNRERARIYAHLSTGCPACSENQHWLETVINTAAQDRSFEFPKETIAAIVAQFREQTATDLPQIRQYFAKLIFDSVLLPQLADVRSVTTEASGRQVLYRAEGYDIDLRFELSDETSDEQLIGQVLPERWDATELTQFRVQLLQHGSVISATNTNARGVFKFAKLISGTYDLKVSVPDAEINIERVTTARAF